MELEVKVCQELGSGHLPIKNRVRKNTLTVGYANCSTRAGRPELSHPSFIASMTFSKTVDYLSLLYYTCQAIDLQYSCQGRIIFPTLIVEIACLKK